MKQAWEFLFYKESWGKFYLKRKSHAHDEDLDIDGMASNPLRSYDKH